MKDSGNLILYIPIALAFMFMWGINGCFEGDGFFGGIDKQFDAIGDIVVLVLKGALFIGVGWFIFEKLKNRDKKSNGS